ncbi:SusC/RagA family TonB-linked outer membrane protein [Mucilaginibacter sp. RS28]|uniref:SusC/RagA family TonB-linked outer membrane protein n=1 Tax=Mucilaginibacter straminoryzae TaxID=2932774 RepID=A0A9X1X557_9SPHI|nr:SusC/RagA family TonB-linked outer membrane protein [Mucilaginibacter straminoryzae]MCJ8208864.1 SusC/RagA family TonB-linked outer membrane protein [Mucilaginibacter straminoryzae]
MKISVCVVAMLTFSISLFAFTKTSGQTITSTTVNLKIQNETLKEALRKIQDQSGFNIFYSSATVDVKKRVSVNNQGASVANTLDQVLKNTGLSYRQEGKSIIIYPTGNPTDKDIQIRRVSGMVVDEEGQPLPGVTILLKSSRMASTATDVNGHFGIDISNDNEILVFSLIGHKTQEVTAKSIIAGIKIVMHPISASLNEVQVIGYGTTTRALNTGSVSSITAKDIANQPVSNPLSAMQGKLPGVQITQNNGLPGAGFRVQIRGVGSINSGTLPLYVIDGVPFTLFNASVPPTDGLNAFGISAANGGETSPLGMINPDDIERIDVLKDADATAIYGSKGANGVVLITTKKGTGGQTRYNLNFYQGTSKVAHFIDELNTADYLAMRRAAFAAAGVTPTTTNAPDLLVWDQNAYTNWQKKFIGGTANTTNADFSINGGNTQNTFLFSTNYRHEGTVFPGSLGANTFSNRLNAGHKSQDNRFGINLNVNYAYQQNNLIGTDLSTLYNLPPNMPLNNADGSLYWNNSITNPLAYLLRPSKNTTTNLLSNMDVHYDLLPGLTLKANMGYSLTGLKQTLETPLTSLNPSTINPSSPSNNTRYADNTTSNYIIEPQIRYQHKIAKGDLTALVGSTFQRTLTDGISLRGTGFSTDALLGSFYNAASVINYGSSNSDYKYTALFGRLNYTWENKYLIDGTFRRDGSSRFGANNRFGNFWAVGAGWVFTEESFMKDIPALSFGKIRGSYGLTGNDQISNYQYDAYYSTSGTANSYQGQAILYPSNVPNPNLHWETNKKLDIAIELGFLKDRIYVKADYFRNRSSDQLLPVSLPTQAGMSSYTDNFPAVVQNYGYEFELNTTNVKLKDFRWSTAFNLTIQRNAIISIQNPSKLFYTYIIGQPVNGIMLYHFTGIDPATGIPTYQDMNGDGSISYANDRAPAPLGHPYYGGITNSFTYKTLTLDVSFLFNHRMGYINNTSSYPFGSTMSNQNISALQRWKAPGDISMYPGATTIGSNPYYLYNSSDANWGDASFIKLKTVSLNYALPQPLVRKIGFRNASVFARGENLYTWAKQKYTYDPETTVSGAAPGVGTGQFIAMPQLRTIVLGLNCTF